MEKAFSVAQDVPGVNPTLSILAALGLEEAVVVIAPVDGETDEQALTNIVPLNVEPETLDADTMAAAARGLVAEAQVAAIEDIGFGDTSPAEILASDSKLSTVLVIINVDWSQEAQSIPLLIQPWADPGFVSPSPIEFRMESMSPVMPEGADSVAIDAAAAARGGPGGGGGGGTGGLSSDYFAGSSNFAAGYDIWIKFKGTGWTAELQQAFKNAADYFTTVITQDIGGGGRIGKVTVDDLYVTAEVKSIDGAGGILGQAGPSHVWTASELTADGIMQFDVADALDYSSIGLWDDIVTHELMHVLGFGSLWDYGKHQVLVSNNEYTGTFALAAYQQIHPEADFIPVEDEGGAGTLGSHWDEEGLTNELMTGYIDGDSSLSTINDNYLSKFSVMSLADLGYQITYQDYTYDGTST